MNIPSWRTINIEPIGRACESSNLMLSNEQFEKLMDFIQEKRYDLSCPIDVTYGCSHYLGIERERMVRNNYFFCGAGLLVASIRCNGDICACLDIENWPSLVQGNVSKDNFWEVWNNKFLIYRTDRTCNSRKCTNCDDRCICAGDSAHTWDWKEQEPLLCVKDLLSKELKNNSLTDG